MKRKYLFEIVPMKNFDLNRKLNSLFRLSIFYSIIVYLVNKKEKTLMIPIGVGIFTIIISKILNQIKLVKEWLNYKMLIKENF